MSNTIDFTPIPPSADTLATNATNALLQHASDLQQYLVDRYNLGINDLWRNQNATASQIVAKLGTNAGALFAASSAFANFILTQYPAASSQLATPINAYTINADGSVTISDNPWTP